MSSKLHRSGEVSPEPMAWPQVAPLDSSAAIIQPYPKEPRDTLAASQMGGRTSHLPGDSDQRVRSAYQQGFEEGASAARAEMAAQLDAINGRLARTIEELAGSRARFRHEAEEDVVALSIAIARRILHRELTVAPEALLGLVKAALEKIEAREVHRVRVRPEDAVLVEQHFERMGLPRRIEVIPDPGLEHGAAILDSSRGALDASVETQLDEIRRGFADLIR